MVRSPHHDQETKDSPAARAKGRQLAGRHYIVETVFSGLALLDYDGDGDVDIYFLNGAALPGMKARVPPQDALYRNDGNWKFTDVTDRAGVGDTEHGLGVAAADYDNDGDVDLYVNNFGPNALYRNNGDGTFTNVAKAAGVEDGDKVGAGTCFLDMDADGDLDLYSAHYVNFTFQNHKTVRFNGVPAYVGPMDFMPTSSSFWQSGKGETLHIGPLAHGVRGSACGRSSACSASCAPDRGLVPPYALPAAIRRGPVPFSAKRLGSTRCTRGTVRRAAGYPPRSCEPTRGSSAWQARSLEEPWTACPASRHTAHRSCA